MTTHYVKGDARWVSRLRANEKTMEVRIDDRDYQTGDRIEVYNSDSRFDCVTRTITHVLRGGQYGIEDGYVILSLEDSRIPELLRLRRENERLVRSNRSLRARARMLTEAAR